MRRAVVVVYLALAACTSHTEHAVSTPCTTDAQCGWGAQCTAGACKAAVVKTCTLHGDCPDDLPVCLGGACNDPCLDAPCGATTTCRDNFIDAPYYECTQDTSCGDQVRNYQEECDGLDLGVATCMSLGLGSGTLRCTPACNFDISDCSVAMAPVPLTCGNHQLDPNEQCDGSTTRSGLTCASLGYSEGGTLSCNTITCQADSRACYSCGDGIIEAQEVCDTAALAPGVSCSSLGFTAGTLHCKTDCSGYTTNDCSTCGNGVIEGNEVCDTTVGNTTCVTLGFLGGTLTCASDCSAFDTSQCNNWYGLGGSSAPGGISSNAAVGPGAQYPSLLFAGSQAWVAWLNTDGIACPVAKFFNGTAWTTVAGGANLGCNSGDVDAPVLAYSPLTNTVYAAWADSNSLADPATNPNIRVAAAAAGTWGTPVVFTDPNAPFGPALAFNGNNVGAVAWQNNQTLGCCTSYVQMAASLDSNGTWAAAPPPQQVTNPNNTDFAWPPTTPAGEVATPRLVIDANQTVTIAWEGSDGANLGIIWVATLPWGASSWTLLPGLPSSGWSRAPVPRLGADGTLWVAFSTGLGAGTGDQVAVYQYNGTAWAAPSGQVGDSNALVPINSEAANHPFDMTLDPNGLPMVAYQDLSADGSTTQIYVKRWQASGWTFIEPSERAKGVSVSPYLALNPSIASLPGAPAQICVAWENVGALVNGNEPPHQIQLVCHAL